MDQYCDVIDSSAGYNDDDDDSGGGVDNDGGDMRVMRECYSVFDYLQSDIFIDFPPVSQVSKVTAEERVCVCVSAREERERNKKDWHIFVLSDNN